MPPAALLALLFALASPEVDAAKTDLVVKGACRDGEPNGIYELRARNGSLRVLGAFHAGKRTGTFIFWNGSGRRIAAIPYDEDVHNGTIALWYAAPAPAGESSRKLQEPVQRGRAHGVRRSWHRNGQPRSEAEYSAGKLGNIAAWDASGHPLAPSQARRVEAQDVRSTDRELAALERLVDEHRPVCHDIAGAS